MKKLSKEFKRKFVLRVMVYLSLYLGLGTFLYFFQRRMVYYPVKQVEHSFFQLILKDDDVDVSVLHVNRDQEKAIIYFGGNGESVVNTAYGLFLQFPEHTIYLLEYRGYGDSGGSPSEKAFYQDALKLYDAVSANHKDISVVGRSLGTGVATYLTSQKKVDRLVLITPFDSIQSVAQKRFPIYPMSIMLSEKYRSVDRVGQFEIPTLILLADNDEIIPIKNSLRLIEAFDKTEPQVITINNSGHNDLSERQEYKEVLSGFLK